MTTAGGPIMVPARPLGRSLTRSSGLRASLVLLALTACEARRPLADIALRHPARDGDAVPEPRAADRLRELGVQFRPWDAPERSIGGRTPCRVQDGVAVRRGASGVRYSKAPLVSAAFAVRLARFETIAQEEARRAFGRPIVRIEHLGSYVCRSVAGAPGVPSQHAFGNAIDVSAFVLRGGRRIVVARDYPRAGAATQRPGARFFRDLVGRLRDERVFGSVLTPDYDARHADHLHLDGRERRWWWPWRS